jgi:hypothetical protein
MRQTAASRRLTRLGLSLCFAASGCLASSAKEARECLDRRESIVYMSQVRQSIAAAWKKPSMGGRVTVSTRVDRKGALRSSSIVVSLRDSASCGDSLRCRMVEGPLRRSMEAALRNARPVGPPPEGALCMLERTLELAFETSERYIQDPESVSP